MSSSIADGRQMHLRYDCCIIRDGIAAAYVARKQELSWRALSLEDRRCKMQSHYHSHQPHIMERPWLLWVPVAALVFVSLGALPAGYSLISDPSGAGVGFPPGTLNSPLFPDYLIPGLFLFFVNGVGSLAAAAALVFRPQWSFFARMNPIRRQEWAWTFAMLMGIILMAWIAIQYFSLTQISPLQPIIFGIGALIVGSLLAPSVREFFHVE